MILLNDVVEILDPNHLYRDWAAESFKHAIYRVDTSCVRSAPVDHYLPRQTVYFQSPGKELGRGRLVASFREHEIKCLSELVDGAVEVDPFAFHFDVSLVHSPRWLSGDFFGVGL